MWLALKEKSDQAFQHYLIIDWDLTVNALSRLPSEQVHKNILQLCENYKKNRQKTLGMGSLR